MKNITIIILLIFNSLLSSAQLEKIFSISREKNIFIYEDKYIKVFTGEDIYILVPQILMELLKIWKLFQK